MREPVHVMGMGLGPDDLSASRLALIGRAAVLVGGVRHLSYFGALPAVKQPITTPLAGVLDFIEAQADTADGPVVVLASGDPLFFGIGNTLIQRLGPERIILHPNVTSMATAFSRLKLPWHDAAWVSLHGRGPGRGHRGQTAMQALTTALDANDLLCVLTDPDNGPLEVRKVVEAHDYAWQMWVLEKLGTPEEHIFVMDEMPPYDQAFAQPNVVVLRKGALALPARPLGLGTPDSQFRHEKGLITKAPVRVLALAALQLAPDHILWDLGAGSGSVGIEATRFLPRGRVCAVEKNRGRVAQIRENIARFKVQNISVIAAEFPQGTADLPTPDRIFVGGGGKDMEQVLDAATGALAPGGRIVVNTVLMETLHLAVSVLEKKGFGVTLTQAQISTSRNMPWGRRMDALNPVWIIAAVQDSIGG